MKKIKQINSVYRTVIGTIATILTTFVLSELTSDMSDKKYAVLLTIISVSVIILLLNTLAEKLFENSTAIRRILFGNDFIEGWWYDITLTEDSKEPRHGVLIEIAYSDYEYEVFGSSFDVDGRQIATFKSNHSNYSNRVLFFQYESHTNYQKSFVELGINQICFDNPPHSYTGFYIDYGDSMRFVIAGQKIPLKELKEFNGFKDFGGKKQFILSKMEKLKSQI